MASGRAKGRALSGAGGVKPVRNPSKGNSGKPRVPKKGNTGNQGVPRRAGRQVGASKTARAVGKVTKGLPDQAVKSIGTTINGQTKRNRNSGAIRDAMGKPPKGIGAGTVNSASTIARRGGAG
jgi:hypothetical protein